jgi:hypothetical protein
MALTKLTYLDLHAWRRASDDAFRALRVPTSLRVLDIAAASPDIYAAPDIDVASLSHLMRHLTKLVVGGYGFVIDDFEPEQRGMTVIDLSPCYVQDACWE